MCTPKYFCEFAYLSDCLLQAIYMNIFPDLYYGSETFMFVYTFSGFMQISDICIILRVCTPLSVYTNKSLIPPAYLKVHEWLSPVS